MTAVDLLKLEKLEIGGVRGRALSQQVQLLHQEFVDTYKLFTEKPYDCLDLHNMVRNVGITGSIEISYTCLQGKIGCPFCRATFKVNSFSEGFYEMLDTGYKLSFYP